MIASLYKSIKINFPDFKFKYDIFNWQVITGKCQFLQFFFQKKPPFDCYVIKNSTEFRYSLSNHLVNL